MGNLQPANGIFVACEVVVITAINIRLSTIDFFFLWLSSAIDFGRCFSLPLKATTLVVD